MLTFASAYRHLAPAEKSYVDEFVLRVETAANKANERITNALHRPIPDAIVKASKGMLERPLVIAAINERITQIGADTEVTHRRIVKELTNIAFSNISDYMEMCPITGRPTYNLSGCTPEQMAAVKKVEHKVSSLGGEELKFETYDKLKALDMLSRIFGLLGEDNAFIVAERKAEQAMRSVIDRNENASDAYANFIGA